MPWLLLLHICALLGWCGTLLYLPAVIADSCAPDTRETYLQHPRFTRQVFTLVATPAAVVAIGSGTALFLTHGIIELWLMAKLTLVIGLVACHVVAGWLVLRNERQPGGIASVHCLLLGIAVAVLVASILWLVLGKPMLDG